MWQLHKVASYQDEHPAQPRMQPVISVERLDIESQGVMEVCQRNH